MKPYETYLTNYVKTLKGRELEAMILQSMSNKIMNIYDKWDTYTSKELTSILSEVLGKNMELWQFFQQEMSDTNNKNTIKVRSMMLSLSVYVIKSTLEIFLIHDKGKVKQLADINFNIAQGLNT